MDGEGDKMKVDMSSNLEKLSIPNDPNYSSLSSRDDKFSYFLESGLEADIALIIGPNKKLFECHKLILMINSSVFAQMFQKNKKLVEIEIQEVEEEQFEIFLNFCYTGSLDFEPSDVIPLLNISSKFDVKDLEEKCQQMLPSVLTVNSAFQVYEQALKYGIKTTCDAALEFICKNAFILLDSEEFENLSIKSLETLIKRDDLAAENEIQVFTALLRWGKKECERQKMPENNSKYLRSVLEEMLKLIRFPQMTPEELTLKVATISILTTEEIMSILLYFNVSNANKSLVGAGLFLPEPRDYYKPAIEEKIACAIYENESPKLLSLVHEHYISFSVNKKVQIYGISLNYVEKTFFDSQESYYRSYYSYPPPSSSQTNTSELKVKIVKEEKNKVLHKFKIEKNTNAIVDGRILNINSSPVELMPNIVYKIIVKTDKTMGYEDDKWKKLKGEKKEFCFDNGRTVEVKIIDLNSSIFKTIFIHG